MSETTIGSFEAKNRLSSLLDRAERGERIWITKRGRRVAVLGPPAPEKEALVERLRDLRASAKKTGPSVKALIEEGRRA